MKPNASIAPPNHRPRRSTGFTLVELLVTITIIIVLVGIGLPIFRGIRAKADNTHCLSNLRKWGSAIALYSTENRGLVECRDWNSIGRETPSAYVNYVGGEESHEAGYRELGKMRCCPALKGKAAISGNGNSLTAYAFTDASTVGSSNAKAASYNLTQINNPARFVIMIEASKVKTPAIIRTAADYQSMVKPLTMKPEMRHGGGKVNALMGDFSIGSFDWKDISRNLTAWTTF